MAAAVAQNNAPVQKKQEAEKTESLWKDVWYSLRQNIPAMVSLGVITLLALVAIVTFVAPQILPYDPYQQDLSASFQGPSAAHWFGTDQQGRDIFCRVLIGSQISLTVGLLSVAISLTIGVTLGALAGYKGGVLDTVIMRVMDVLLAVPSILLSIALVSAMGTSVTNMMLAISISNIPPFARIVRSAVLTIKNEEYIEAARAIGASDKRIILKHILPNCMAPIIVQATLSIAGSILAIASLSFIGLGISPPTPEWGSMVSTGRQYFRAAWWVCAFPGFAIMLTILSLNLLGDGLRDALDPRYGGHRGK